MKNFVKLFFIFMLFSLIISGCVVVADPEDVFLYDFGLTGDWACDNSGTSDLTLNNQTGYDITSGKYYVGATEPNWSTTGTAFDFSSVLSDNSFRTYTIGTIATDIIIGGASAIIWVKFNSGSDYVVGAFDYNSGDSWTLTVYAKN